MNFQRGLKFSDFIYIITMIVATKAEINRKHLNFKLNREKKNL